LCGYFVELWLMRKCYDEWAVSNVVCEGAQGSPQRGGNRVVRAIYFEVEVEGWNFFPFCDFWMEWCGVWCGSAAVAVAVAAAGAAE
jgi:hypothetical protein